MNFLLPLVLKHRQVEVRNDSIVLRSPRLEDFEQWRVLREKSRSFLQPWEPAWQSDEFTRFAYRVRLRHQQSTAADQSAHSFFIFQPGTDVLLGGITLSNIRKGVAQTGTLGYWIGEPYARQGHMTSAVLALRSHAFSALGLHRLEAACLPSNTPSIRLLERTGFEREGFAKAYLKINGRWEDHILWGQNNGL